MNQKRITAALLSLSMLGSIGGCLAPAAESITLMASAADVQSGTCGENVTWAFDESTGTLTISGTGPMYAMYGYRNPWTSFAESIKSVVIGEGVTSIGADSFYGFDAEGNLYTCENLSAVSIPSTVTAIGENAFQLTPLTSVTIPEGVTSIGNYAFEGCKLTEISLPSSLTSVGIRAFGATPWLAEKKKENPCAVANGILLDGSECSGDVVIPDGVTYIANGAFNNNGKITSVKIPDTCTSIGYWAFGACREMTSVTIPDSVTSISANAFDTCRGLTSVKLPSGITRIEDCAFIGCTGLTSIEIPDGVTSIGNSAFYECSGLESVVIPDSVTSSRNFLREANSH